MKYPSDEIQNAVPDPRGLPLLPLPLLGRLSSVPSSLRSFLPLLGRRRDDLGGNLEEETYATLGPHLRTTSTTLRSSSFSLPSRLEALVVRIVSVSIIVWLCVGNREGSICRRVECGDEEEDDGLGPGDKKDASRTRLFEPRLLVRPM